MEVVLITLLAFALASIAKSETVTFEWDQEDVTNLKEWKMEWGDSAGGPYVDLVTLPYNPGDPAGVFSSPVEAQVTGQQGTTVTKYFILRACGDIPQEGGGTLYECSDPSNEVAYGFWIPPGKFSVPIQFRIQPTQ
jgi:hypothetical protein